MLDFSIWSDIVFAQIHVDVGNMTEAEFAQYQALSQKVFALNLPPPHLSMYALTSYPRQMLR